MSCTHCYVTCHPLGLSSSSVYHRATARLSERVSCSIWLFPSLSRVESHPCLPRAPTSCIVLLLQCQSVLGGLPSVEGQRPSGCIPFYFFVTGYYSYISCPYSSPPVRVSLVTTVRGYASWMFTPCAPNFSLYYADRSERTRAWLGFPALVLFPRRKRLQLRVLRISVLTTTILPLHAGETSLLYIGISLNRAQMLVRDSEALARFRIDHKIPDDVVIERTGPNDDTDWVEGEGNRVPIRTWFIYQAGLRFSLSKLLKTVLSLCGLTFMQISVNFVQTVLAVEALMQREGKPNQPQMRLVTDSPNKDQYLNDFVGVSGRWEFPTGEPDLYSVPRRRGYVPVGFNSCFWRRSDRCSAAISTVNNYGRSRKVSDLLDYVPLYRYTILLRATRQGHPVLPPLQIRSQEPINLPSSDSDIAIVEPREVVEHSYSHSGSSSFRLQWDEEIMAPKVRILGKGQALRIEPPLPPEAPSLTMSILAEDQSIAPSSMTYIALGNAVMLPQDVANHAAETTTEFGGKLVILGAQRAVSTSLQLKQGVVDLKKANQKANSLEKELKQAKSKLADARQLAELRLGVFQEGWLACLKELKIPLDHPAWSSFAPPIQLPASPERYSPIILPGFNEEEYAILLADEGNVNTVVAEARIGIEGMVDED
ncbi:hypothetical protein Acr_00g0007130 [Actinidia rufa]|uniref:Uncharacterized protein n=1 Tax=Actinidia rufa TaxID=165716 RepID=A0A7J0DA14_9ERIC|nr:hypothetical protein Acr_00g0007130 [Actinidia rufa]